MLKQQFIVQKLKDIILQKPIMNLYKLLVPISIYCHTHTFQEQKKSSKIIELYLQSDQEMNDLAQLSKKRVAH